jgi:hypothetical protein
MISVPFVLDSNMGSLRQVERIFPLNVTLLFNKKMAATNNDKAFQFYPSTFR